MKNKYIKLVKITIKIIYILLIIGLFIFSFLYFITKDDNIFKSKIVDTFSKYKIEHVNKVYIQNKYSKNSTIEFKDKEKIKYILNLIKNRDYNILKEKKVYNISLRIKFEMIDNKVYCFDIYKDNNSSIVYFFLRTNRKSYYFISYDYKNIINNIYDEYIE